MVSGAGGQHYGGKVVFRVHANGLPRPAGVENSFVRKAFRARAGRHIPAEGAPVAVLIESGCQKEVLIFFRKGFFA